MKPEAQKSLAMSLLAAISCGATALAAPSMTDYGATPPIAKPSSDQLAANQKLDFHVDQFTGRFSYTIPIQIPPPRHGFGPSIALTYDSSQGNGWCGVGWNLDVPSIQMDTRFGVPVKYGVYNAGHVFSVAGTSGKLVRASDGTYRSEINTSFLKFAYCAPEGSPDYWSATDKSGTKYFFGTTSDSRMETSFGTFKWFVSSMVDPNGNKITYSYTRENDRNVYLSRITYNANVNASTPLSLCTVDFVLKDRRDVPSSLISGLQVSTRKLLDRILVRCDDQSVRRYQLTYTTSPSTGRSLLQSVTEFGWDDTSSLPPYTFSYQAQNRSFSPSTEWSIEPFCTTQDPSGVTPSLKDAQLLDIDGDALPDRVTRSSPRTSFKVQKNTGSGFGPIISWSPVENEQQEPNATDYNTLDSKSDSVYWGSATIATLTDMNGDRLPDRVMRQAVPNDEYEHFQVQLNTGTGFEPVFPFPGVQSDPALQLKWLYHSPSGTSASGITTLAALCDLNGDGFPDRLMWRGGDNNRFDVQRNDGERFLSLSQWALPSDPEIAGIRQHSDLNACYVELLDMNGDGLPDRVFRESEQLGIQLNNGANRFTPHDNWGLEASEEFSHVVLSWRYYSTQLMDINGDGLPDLVRSPGGSAYSVRYNTGSTFASSEQTWSFSTSGGGSSYSHLQAWDDYGTIVLFIDVNGDGLADRVTKDCMDAYDSIHVQLNAGPFPDLLVKVANGIGGTLAVTYTPSTRYDNSDGTRPRLPFPVHTVSSVLATIS